MHHKLILTVAASLAVALVTGQAAEAHLVAKPKGNSLKAVEKSQVKNLRHARYVCNHGRKFHKRWSCRAVKWLSRELDQTRAALRPSLRSLSSHGPVQYTAGWLCIHSREGAWNSNTGNGYYGGLQMTEGWMGLVGQAHRLSPMQQIQAAERGYQKSGYSRAWLSGQWPNTYPPCAHLF